MREELKNPAVGLGTSLKTVLLSGACVLALGMGASTWSVAAAQDQTSQAEEAEDESEEQSEDKVVVTGSRIRRDEFTSASPIQIIDGDTSRQAGLIDTAEILQQSTAASGPQVDNAFTSLGFLSDNGPGATTLSLRGLGTGRSLVLVNGRRVAPAGVGGAPVAADLSLIPASLIDRVEILLDGASSVYGSDAVAGVANVILRKDFEGFELSGSYNAPEIGVGDTQSFSATWGVTSDRGSMNFAATYTQADEVSLAEFGPCPLDIEIDRDGRVLKECNNSGNVNLIAIVPFSILTFDEELGQFAPAPPGFDNADVTLTPETSLEPFSQTFRRYTFFTSGEYDLNLWANDTIFFEASYSNRQNNGESVGNFTAALTADNPTNIFGAPLSIFLPNSGSYEVEVDQTRLVTGLRGDFPVLNDLFGVLGSNWSYEVFGSYSRARGYNTEKGTILSNRLKEILLTTRIEDGELVCGYGQPQGFGGFGQPVTPRCVPIDFLDPDKLVRGEYTKEEARFLKGPRSVTTIVEQSIVSAYLTGDLIELPYGTMAGVFGVEFRDDEIVTQSDAVARDGTATNFFTDSGASGSRSLAEFFAEIEVPILRGLPFAEELTFNGSARYTEEENFGAQWTYRLQGIYRPTDFLTLRSTFGTSFRAPNLRESFLNGETGFLGGVVDPCVVPFAAISDDTNDYDPTLDDREQTTLDNCVLQGVDPTSLGLQAPGTDDVAISGNAANTQRITGGNENLLAETSEAISAGFVVEQPFFESFDLRFAFNFFRVEVENSVAEPTTGFIINDCLNANPNLSSAFCSRLTRDGEGFLSFVDTSFLNIGELVTEGYDYNLFYGQEFLVRDKPLGLTVDLRATETTRQFQNIFGVRSDFVSEIGDPEWQLIGDLNLTYDDFRLFWRTRYISGVEDKARENFGSGSLCAECRDVDFIDDYYVHTASVTWEQETWAIQAGVSNVFDEEPPMVDGTEAASARGRPVGLGYDLLGRTFFVNATKRF